MSFVKEVISWDTIVSQSNEKSWLPNSAIKDYVFGESSIRPFYENEPSFDGIVKGIASKKAEKIDRQLLIEVLKEQYTGIDVDPSCINILAKDNTYTICTGHQLCLFTGPLFFVYKILSTIRLAEELCKSHPKYHFVPVYWMASEDHDFDEINHIRVFNEKVTWEDHQKGMVGDYKTRSIDKVIEQLESMMVNEKHKHFIIESIKKAYLGQQSLAAATRLFVHELFGKYGLIVLDGNDPRLKSQFAKVMEDDLLDGIPENQLQDTSEKLSQNYKLQAHYRDVNTFYVSPQKRERIHKRDKNKFILGDNGPIVSKKEILTQLQKNPERFSPNVVLRPLYQEKILPNLAYVGGPGELAYWFQLKSLFSHYGVSFPTLVLRNSAILLRKSMIQKVDKLGLKSKDLLQPVDHLTNTFLNNNIEDAISLSQERKELSNFYGSLALKLQKNNPELATFVKAELNRGLKAIKKLEKNLVKAGKNQHKASMAQLIKLHKAIYPIGKPQERVESVITYLATYGNGFIGVLKDQMEPFSKGVIILKEK